MRRLLALLAFVFYMLADSVLYTCQMEVVNIVGDTAVLQTRAGHLYEIYADDLELGDRVSCVVFTNGTWETIEDDMVLRACVG